MKEVKRYSDVQLYREMMRIRLLEEELLRLHSRGLLHGTVHTSIGQEAIAVGALAHLNPEDRVFSNHRGHGHFLAQGGSPNELIAEIMGRVSGTNGGRGGSQHLHKGRFVSSGVQGGLIPTALGTAVAVKKRGDAAVTVVFIGDGTLGQGIVYETLNMAALWKAPILFILENNRIAQTTPVELAVAGDMAARARAFGVRANELIVEDAQDVWTAAEEAFRFVRTNGEPFFQVFHTFRLGPHSKGDDDRPTEEIERWREKDPLLTLGTRVPQKERETIDRELAAEIQQYSKEAINAPWPEASSDSLLALAPTPTDGRNLVATGDGPGPRVVESLNRSLHELMASDQSVLMIGEDILDPYGGAFKVTKGLSTLHPERVWSTPISEAGVVGVAAGLALAGMKPVVELMFGDFLTLASDQIVNTLGKFYFLSSGESKANVVIRTPMGGGRGYGATHSQSLEKMFLGVPGIKVVACSPVLDPGALLYNAVEYDPNPVLFIENKLLYGERVRQVSDGWVEDFQYRTSSGLYPTVILSPTGEDARDVTVICYGRTALMAMEASIQVLLDSEIVADVVVVSQLSPLPLEGMSDIASKSPRVVIVEEGTLEVGWGAEVLARLVEEGFQGRARRVGAMACPIPSSRPLENIVLPSTGTVRTAIENLMMA